MEMGAMPPQRRPDEPSGTCGHRRGSQDYKNLGTLEKLTFDGINFLSGSELRDRDKYRLRRAGRAETFPEQRAPSSFGNTESPVRTGEPGAPEVLRKLGVILLQY